MSSIESESDDAGVHSNVIDAQTVGDTTGNPIQKFWNDRQLRSSISESCFSFSESIVRPAAERGSNVIGFVGEDKQVGNSTVALLSATFNAMTRNIPSVLVDCDFRRPVMKSWFEIAAPSGISDAMADPNELEIATRTTAYNNLSVIHVGSEPKRLRSEPGKLGSVISRLSLEFSNVFVDLPTFEERQIPLYSQVDLIVLVGDITIQHNQKSIRMISKTLAKHSVPFAGVFMNERP